MPPVTVRLPALVPAVLSLCLVAPATTQTPEAASSAASTRARLVELQREAADLLTQAAGAGVGPDEVQRLLGEAARRLEALSVEPDHRAASTAAAALPAVLRAELARAARELRGAIQTRPDESRPFDARPYLDLLERARAQIEGEIALGLGFQGSYSQSKPKEPVYGGHASSMGPPPAPAPDAADTGAGSPSPAQFEEVTGLAARTYCGGPTKDHILESGGSGLALFDYDGDGRLDIYLVTAAELTASRQRVPHRNTLYRNLGQMRFEDVSAKAGVDAAAWGNGACAGDFDGDGRLDLYVTNWGPNLLYRNKGDGTFSDVAARAGVAAGGWSTGCAFLDADADGDLDLYVARYVETTWDDVVRARRTLTWRNGPRIMVGPAGLPGESDLFFENRGNGTFVESTEAHGLTDPARAYGFGVVATDYDDDGWIDLFVANDSNPNFLHHNRGNGTFESAGLLSGVAVNAEGRAQAGMGVDSGDSDGDGRLDLVVTTFAHDTSSLYKNLDGTRFEDVTAASGLAAPTFEPMGWGTAFLDADLDGRLDLFFANGHIFADIGDFPALKETFRQKNQFLLNQGAMFRDVSATAGAGLQVQRVGRGLAVGDLDDDGDLDVVVSNMDDVPTLLQNRQRTGNHWVAFRLASPGPNRFAIGARVTLNAGGRHQVREVRSGGSYLSQSDLRAHFGLGSHAEPVDVEVRMPGGDLWQWRALAADQLHQLVLSQSRRTGKR
jgi:enediyne biosynthesis protein E4